VCVCLFVVIMVVIVLLSGDNILSGCCPTRFIDQNSFEYYYQLTYQRSVVSRIDSEVLG